MNVCWFIVLRSHHPSAGAAARQFRCLHSNNSVREPKEEFVSCTVTFPSDSVSSDKTNIFTAHFVKLFSGALTTGLRTTTLLGCVVSVFFFQLFVVQRGAVMSPRNTALRWTIHTVPGVVTPRFKTRQVYSCDTSVTINVGRTGGAQTSAPSGNTDHVACANEGIFTRYLPPNFLPPESRFSLPSLRSAPAEPKL